MTGIPASSPRFITLEEAIGWHRILIAQYGGASGIRDVGLLNSALAQPQQGFEGRFAHAFPFEMAAAYAFHIAKNHPFNDGNKRVALLCCGAFLHLNGWVLHAGGTEAADAILGLLAGTHDKTSFAAWLESRCQRKSDPVAAHRHAACNRSEIEQSGACGCFYCLAIFPPEEIRSWVPDRSGDTARCPKCGIDSVIGSASGYPIQTAFLAQMKDIWFS